MILSIKKIFLSVAPNLFLVGFVAVTLFLLPRAFVSAAPPIVTLDTSSFFVSSGSDVTLTWTSTSADSCTASSGRWSATGPSGGFNGSIATNGWAYSSFLYYDTWFRVSCSNVDGTTSQSVTVIVQLELSTPADPYTTGQPVTFYGSRGTGTYSWTANGGGTPGTQSGGTDFTVTWGSAVAPGCSQGGGSVRLSDSFDGQQVCQTFTVQLPAFSLNVTKNGTGLGTVTSNPAGISCGADCSESYNSGTSVVLSAVATAGSTFAGWAGCTSTSGVLPNQTCTVSMTANRNVTATFNIITYSLSVTRIGAGTGQVTLNPPNATYGLPTSRSYNGGTVVTMTAVPNAGSAFSNWSGDADCVDGSVTMSAARNCTANFSLILPNLSAIIGAPPPITAGNPQIFAGTVSNTNNASTGVGFNNLFQVATAAGGGGTVSTISVNALPALAGNSNANVNSAPYTFPAAGIYSVRLCADQPPLPNGVVVESNEGITNCSGWRSVTVVATPINGACAPTHYNCASGTSINNLSGVSWTWTCQGSGGGSNALCSELQSNLTAGTISPAVAVAGTPRTFSSTVSNIGTVSTIIGFSNFFQVATEADGNGTIYDQPSTPMSAIINGATAGLQLSNYTFPSDGVWSMRVCADKTSSGDLGVVDETDESNNCGSPWTNITVTPAITAVVDIRANGSDAPNPIPYGETANITWTYANASSCSLDPASIGTITIPPDNGSGSFSTTLTADRTYTISCLPNGINSTDSVAVTVLPLAYNLNVIKTGQGTVTSTSNPTQASQINCGSGCQFQTRSFEPDAVVTLQYTLAPGRIFTGWSGDCSGKGACNLAMDGSKTVFANFAIDPDYREF